MTDITHASPLSSTHSATLLRQRDIAHLWSHMALGAVLLLSIFMNFFQLGQNGYGNLYYAAGVRSMGDSWSNFFFVSFDPGGFVTIDKPPFGFWLQTLSTKLFGFTPFSIFFPQALCGVLAVLLLYSLVRRHFGVTAGLVAALALAVSPISVVTDRNNTIDGILALALLLAAWAVIHASETGKLRWLLLSSVFVGLGFNIKMAEAYLVVPALGMTYFLCAPHKIWTRIWHLLLALLVMLAISLSWAMVVDLTPASQRPYVGSTQNNSELNLAFGYNGFNRLNMGGNRFGGRNQPQADANTHQQSGSASTENARSSSRPRSSLQLQSSNNSNTEGLGSASTRTAQAQGGGDPFTSSAPGPFRLFSASLGGQIAWLLPFALFGMIALAWQRRFIFQKDRQQLGLVLWGFWLLTMTVFFTLYGSFHEYYMTEMAPGLSALVGIGLVVMWQQYRSRDWHGWLLPIALVVTAATQIYMLTSYPAWSQWLSPIVGLLTALVVITLIIVRLKPQLDLSKSASHVAGIAISAGLLALLVAPTTWASYSVIQNTESSSPMAGPSVPSAARGGFPGGNNTNRTRGQNGLGGFAGAFGGESAQADPALISYLEAHQGNAKFLVATPSSMTADAIILTANKPVMALGGFMGRDPIVTTSQLQTLIQQGTVRFFLVNSPRATQQLVDQLPQQYRDFLSGRGGGGFGGFEQSTLSTWVSKHCSTVPTTDWQSSTRNARAALNGNQLYDCASNSL